MMRVAVITSQVAPYPSPRFPQYYDYDDIFSSLAHTCDVHLLGNILRTRPYASSQVSFSKPLDWNNPRYWNNPLAIWLSNAKPIERLRDTLDSLSASILLQHSVSHVLRKKVELLYNFPLPFDRYTLTLSKRTAKPLVVELWEDYACFKYEILSSLGLPKACIVREIRRMYSWILNTCTEASRIVVPTMVFANRLHKLGVEKEKIHVVPVCVDRVHLSDPQHIAKRHNIGEEKVVFYLGSLSSWHDAHTLLNALRYVKSQITLIIAGSPSFRFIAERTLKKLHRLSEISISRRVKVIFPGRLMQSEVGAYLSMADICVAPYTFQYHSGFFPAKVVRYMLAGKAIVATDLPEIREMFRGRQAALLVPQRNPKALAEAFDYLNENSEERSRLGMVAQEIAENNYLTEHHTEHLVHIFKELL